MGIFTGIFLLLEAGGFICFLQLCRLRRRRLIFGTLYWAVAIFVIGLLWLTLGGDRIRTTVDFHRVYLAIAVLMLDMAPKFMICLFVLAALLLRLLRQRNAAALFLHGGFIIAAGTLLVGIYGIFIGRKTATREHVTITLPTLPDSLNGLTIAQISDFHLGGFYNDGFIRRCADIINQYNPDIVVFTGDMVNNYFNELKGFEEALTLFDAPLGKYAISGNHDYGDYSLWPSAANKRQNREEINVAIRQAGFRLLLNETHRIAIGDTALWLLGVENWGHHSYSNLRRAMADMPEGAFAVLLTHNPAHWPHEVIGKTNIALSLAGHTHGGQSSLMLAGIRFSPIRLIERHWAGLYRSGNQYLYVNRGFGCVGLLARIDMPPEITFITLKKYPK